MLGSPAAQRKKSRTRTRGPERGPTFTGFGLYSKEETEDCVFAVSLFVMSGVWISLLMIVPPDIPLRLLCIFLAGFLAGRVAAKAFRDILEI